MTELTVVLPNFNGRGLLERNLPSLVDALKNWRYQIIVVDDASTDDSVDFLYQSYPEVEVIEQLENRGFSATCNLGLKHARGKFTCIVNTDVRFSIDYFQNIFSELDEGFFAAKGLIRNESRDGAIVSLDSIAHSWMNRGFWRFNKRIVYAKSDTFSANQDGRFPLLGCCFVAHTEKFRKLGGFDEIFSPFYWEDSDLPFRALRAGEKILYVPQAEVFHQLSSTINTYRSRWERKIVSDRNKFIFTWRHMHSKNQWLAHIGFQSFYFMLRWLRFDWSYYCAFLWSLCRITRFWICKENLKRHENLAVPQIEPFSGQLKASLIISVYRDAEKLRCILRALAFQSEKSFEIVVSEDGISSEIRECVDAFRKNFPRIIHLTQEDLGFRKNKALNAAIRSAITELLIFIDGDCIPHRRFIEAHISSAEKGVVCVGRRVELGKRFSKMLINRPREISPLSRPLGYLARLFPLIFDQTKNPESGLYLPWLSRFCEDRALSILGCNFSCHKATISAINGFNEDYSDPGLGEDSDIEWRLKMAGFRVKNVKFLTPLFHLWHSREWTLSEKNVSIYESTRDQGVWRAQRGLYPGS